MNPTRNRERKCSTCKHYQPSPLWRKGWCRNPLLYDRNTNHLVEADSLACNRTFIDYWEPMTGPGPTAGPQPRTPKPRIAPSIPMDTTNAQGQRTTVTGNTPAAGMAAVAPKAQPRNQEIPPRPALSLVTPDFDEFEAMDPHATLQIEEIAGPEELAKTKASDRIKKARVTRGKKLFGIPQAYLLTGLIVAVLLMTGGGVWLMNRNNPGVTPTPVPTSTVAAVVPSPTGFGDPTATVPPEPTAVPTPPPPTDVIAVGGWVQVQGTEGLIVRDAPTRQGARITVIRSGTTARVIDGPQEADGFTWWKLEGFNPDDPAQTGWSAGQFLAPIPPPSPET